MPQTQVLESILRSNDSPYQSNRLLLKKLLLTAHLGRLKINDQAPDQAYTLGDYFFDDEQMVIDYSRLSPEARNNYEKWLLEEHQADKQMAFLSRTAASEYRGFTAEQTLSWWGRLKSWLFNQQSDHWKVDDINLSLDYQLTGLEICKGNNGLILGLNQIMTDPMPGKYHEPEDPRYAQPMGNAKRIYLSDHVVDLLTSKSLDEIDFTALLKQPHLHAIAVDDPAYRYKNMLEYRRMQKFLILKPWYARLGSMLQSFWHQVRSYVQTWTENKPQPSIPVPTRAKASKKKAGRLIPLAEMEGVEILRREDNQHILVREKTPPLDTLVYSGGGGKIFAHIGVWKAFREVGLRPSRFGGSSAGAIMAMLCYLGYEAEEIQDFFKSVKKDNLVYNDNSFFRDLAKSFFSLGQYLYRKADYWFNGAEDYPYRNSQLRRDLGDLRASSGQLSNLIQGISTTTALKSHLDLMMLKKVEALVARYHLEPPPEKITFAYLASIKARFPDCELGEELMVPATNLQDGSVVYFSSTNRPEIEITEAVTASASLPVVFKPTVIDGCSFSDAGIKNNIPVNYYHDDCRTLLESATGNHSGLVAVQFDTGTEQDALHRIDKVYKENFFTNWIYRLLTGVNDPASGWEQDRLNMRHHALRVIIIPNPGSSTNFSVSDADQSDRIKKGYQATREFLAARYAGIEPKNPEANQVVENVEAMYSTFSSLEELLTYCCYRGSRVWFERVKGLIADSATADRDALLLKAKNLETLYFSESMTPVERPASLPRFPLRPQPSASNLFERGRSVFGVFHPLLNLINGQLFRNESQLDQFLSLRHQITVDNILSLASQFGDVLSGTNHVLLALIVDMIQSVDHEFNEGMRETLAALQELLRQGDQNLFQDGFYGNWQDLTASQRKLIEQLLREKDFQKAAAYCRTLANGCVPLLEPDVEGNFTVLPSEEELGYPNFLSCC